MSSANSVVKISGFFFPSASSSYWFLIFLTTENAEAGKSKGREKGRWGLPRG
jgi:hypothetical protein